jgi:saxitoxin biosynthesis operon SxtJ-like protein
MAHEDLTREQDVEGSTDRVFGVVFAVAFLLIASWPLFYGGQLRWWACFVGAAFALVALAKPAVLRGPNRLWMKFGILLGRVVSPVALGILFYAVLTPVGVMMRLTGKDPLRRSRDPGATSYWLPRRPPGPPPDSMTNQF